MIARSPPKCVCASAANRSSRRSARMIPSPPFPAVSRLGGHYTIISPIKRVSKNFFENILLQYLRLFYANLEIKTIFFLIFVVSRGMLFLASLVRILSGVVECHLSCFQCRVSRGKPRWPSHAISTCLVEGQTAADVPPSASSTRQRNGWRTSHLNGSESGLSMTGQSHERHGSPGGIPGSADRVQSQRWVRIHLHREFGWFMLS